LGKKLALIVGNGQYDEPSLARLKAPDVDVNQLAQVLQAPEIGRFDQVRTLVNQPLAVVYRAVAEFFADPQPDDLLFLYFSGHGVLDPQGRLFLAVKDTQRRILSGTAIPANFISEQMDGTRAKRQVPILDCCNSGKPRISLPNWGRSAALVKCCTALTKAWCWRRKSNWKS
jgi:uncharacterized caspase-like protein